MLNYSTKRIEYLYSGEDTWLKKVLKKLIFIKNPYTQDSLRSPGIRFKRNSVEEAEWDKCKNDIVYFAENYFHIHTVYEGIKLIELRGYQKEILRYYTDHSTISIASRQMGMSTLNRIYALWLILFHTRYVQLINEPMQAHFDNIEALKLAYSKLPYYMQKGVERFNRNEIVVDDLSRITDHRLKKALSPNEVKYFTVIVDNTAYLHSADLAELEKKLRIGAKCIITGTPNGVNAFYRLFENASVGKNTYKLNAIKVHWRNRLDWDDTWAKNMIANIGEEAFNQEFNLYFINKRK